MEPPTWNWFDFVNEPWEGMNIRLFPKMYYFGGKNHSDKLQCFDEIKSDRESFSVPR